MIVVIGANGMLGSDLISVLPGDVRGIDIDEIDITSLESVQKVLFALKPGIIINAAAYTDVDGCESDAERAFAVNGEGVANLALVARDMDSLLVQISTDYLFDGTKGSPYVEDDATNPLSIYGQSKYAGELNARLTAKHLIVRTQWLYGVHGKNFVETMLRLAQEKDSLSVVDDQIGSPTWTVDLCHAIVTLINKKCLGTFHAVNSGYCSWNEFAKAIFEEEGISVPVMPLATKDLGRPAPRPLYSVLDTDKLMGETGLRLQGWRDALRHYLKTRRS
jgi:dTDP-4-dehydrorhamnose reductase